ncbi:glycine-rich cell wall structural protein-like [Lucilia sericata]|uniref:glycine-rich cell wall structural protein-like n=1 Tax=Lucilia sericata TaxID=13632 RepID=UPI0018A8380B|nr:glycine-rich cell wall structural protein-like [Lucilia sericata]
MRLLLILALLGIVAVITAIPATLEYLQRPTSLLAVADAGDFHSNNANRLARYYGGGGWGGRGGGGWGSGGGGWGGGGWGGRRGGGWGGGGWGGRGGVGWGVLMAMAKPQLNCNRGFGAGVPGTHFDCSHIKPQRIPSKTPFKTGDQLYEERTRF